MSKDIDLIDESNQHWTHTHRYSKCREELALITTERDALQADNARLREALEAYDGGHSIDIWDTNLMPSREWDEKRKAALAATTAQSLARLRNQAIEKCAVELDGHWDMAAGIIRAMKEPE